MPVWLGPAEPTSGLPDHAQWKPLGQAQGREKKPDWASGEVLAQGHFSGLNPFPFSKLF
jgi:hypothetical protein